jgi:hypothetical protein
MAGPKRRKGVICVFCGWFRRKRKGPTARGEKTERRKCEGNGRREKINKKGTVAFSTKDVS